MAVAVKVVLTSIFSPPSCQHRSGYHVAIHHCCSNTFISVLWLWKGLKGEQGIAASPRLNLPGQTVPGHPCGVPGHPRSLAYPLASGRQGTTVPEPHCSGTNRILFPGYREGMAPFPIARARAILCGGSGGGWVGNAARRRQLLPILNLGAPQAHKSKITSIPWLEQKFVFKLFFAAIRS